MSLSHLAGRLQPRGAAFLSAALPLVAVLAVRIVVPGPGAAQAAQARRAKPHEAADLRVPGDSWLRSLTFQAESPAIEGSPFYMPTPAQAAPEPTVVPGAGTSVVTLDPAPSLRLTAILQGGGKTLAMADGKPYTLGDPVAPGWTLVEINPRERTITLRHEADEREHVVAIHGQ